MARPELLEVLDGGSAEAIRDGDAGQFDKGFDKGERPQGTPRTSRPAHLRGLVGVEPADATALSPLSWVEPKGRSEKSLSLQPEFVRPAASNTGVLDRRPKYPSAEDSPRPIRRYADWLMWCSAIALFVLAGLGLGLGWFG